VRNGASLYVIDPRRTTSAEWADAWLGIDVGSDIALANAMGREILAAGGDWVTGKAGDTFELDLRVTLETNDGALIFMTFTGLRDDAHQYFRTLPRFETAASNDRSGRPVSDASAVTHVSDLPATSALCVPIAISSGVMSTAVTRAPRAAAASAALPVPQARSTSTASRSGKRRSTASITSMAMLAMRSATAS